MESYSFEGNTFYYTESGYFAPDATEEWKQKHPQAIADCFTKRPLFREILKAYGDVRGLSGHVLLRAYGLAMRAKQWTFYDGRKTRKMQDWVDEIDGNVLAILLQVPNMGDYELHSQTSVIIHPSGNVSLLNLVRRQAGLRIFVPGEGYMESSSKKLRKLVDALKE